MKAILADTDPCATWANALFGSTRAMRHESESELAEEQHIEEQCAEGDPGSGSGREHSPTRRESTGGPTQNRLSALSLPPPPPDH